MAFQFIIESELGKGTKLNFWFEHNNIDRPPMGDLAGVFVLTIAQNEEIRFIMNYKTDKDIFSFDTQEIKEALDGIPLNNNDIIKFLREMIEENLKDIEANQAVIVRRDTREKIVVSLDEIQDKVGEVLDTIQSDMLENGRKHRDEHTSSAKDFTEFADSIENKPGFVKAMWCGDRACEDEIKEKTGATSRCIPFEQEHIADTCICCGKPAKSMVYWGKAY